MAGIENMAEGTQDSGPEVAAVGVQVGSNVSAERQVNNQPMPTTPGVSASVEAVRQFGAVARETPGISPTVEAVRQAVGVGPQIVGKVPESVKILQEIVNQLGGAPEWLQELAEQKSEFRKAREIVELVSKLSPAALSDLEAARRTELNTLLNQSKETMNKLLVPETDKGKEILEHVLYFVRDDIRRVYIEALQPTPKVEPDSWYPTPTPKTLEERIDTVEKALGNYQERFWDYGETTLKRIFGDGVDIKALRQEYEGVASYIAKRATTSIGKELRGLILQPDPKDSTKEEFGDYYLADIKKELEETKGERERKRREERKRATADERLHYNDWREKFDFNWAETPEELDDSVEDWLDYFQQALPLEAEESVYQEVQKALTNALSSLEKARNRIGLEANSVLAHRLREKVVGHVTTIAGVRLLESRGGFEYFIKLRTDFAANYNGYFDGMYLKEGFALMGDALSDNDGEIYKGGSKYLNKPLAGDTKTFRSTLERKAIKYGSTHELYITKNDIEGAKAATEVDKARIRDEVRSLSLSEEEARERYNQELQKFNRRYGWREDDAIEELLLFDKRGQDRAEKMASNNPNDPDRKAAEERWKVRTDLFKGIKEMLDKEDITDEEKRAGITQGLLGLTQDQRRERIRDRIRAKITEEGNTFLLQEINALPDQADQDRALWKWVRDYNKPRIELRREGSADEPWFPSRWDMERLSIERPEDLVDRALRRYEENGVIIDEFKAMVEEVNDAYKGLTEDQIKRRVVMETPQEYEARVRKEVIAEMNELDMKGKEVPPGEAHRRYEEKMKQLPEVIEEKVESILFQRKQRETRAIRNYNANVAQDKFLGFQARWGGLTTRVVNENGEVELRTIYSLAEEILKAKIDLEAEQVKEKVKGWREGYAVTNPSLSPAEIDTKAVEIRAQFKKDYPNKPDTEIDRMVDIWRRGFVTVATAEGLAKGLADEEIAEEIEEKTIKQTRLFRRNATFAATLGLRELGIANDLPLSNLSYYSDVAQIGAFAPLVGYTDDEKGQLVELIERERREKEAVFSFMADVHMDGRILVVKDSPGLLIEDENGVQKEAHEESRVRPRVINEGGVLKLRDLYECNFMISTSGGVKVADLNAKISRLGVYDEAYENGSKNKREWQGYRKGRAKWQLRQQSFYNAREWNDSLAYVQRLAGAAVARKFLVGGEIQGQGTQPGVLNETMKGAWRDRYEFLDPDKWLTTTMTNFLAESRQPEQIQQFKDEIRKRLEQDETFKALGIRAKDKLVEVGGDIISFLRSYLAARAYQRNIGGYASYNWWYDNELIARAYFKELARRSHVVALEGEVLGRDGSGNEIYAKGGEIIALLGGEELGDQGQAFAVEGRTKAAVKIFEAVLRGSTYEIPDEKYKRKLEQKMRKAEAKVKAKRTALVNAILPKAAQANIGVEEKKLKGKEVELKEGETKKEEDKGELEKLADMEAKFVDLLNGKVVNDKKVLDRAAIEDQKKKLQEQNKKIEDLETQIAKMTNQAVEAELDRQINSGDLTHQFLRKQIAGRRGNLAQLNTSTKNMEWEINRLINYYIDTRVHKEVVGEWPARLAA